MLRLKRVSPTPPAHAKNELILTQTRQVEPATGQAYKNGRKQPPEAAFSDSGNYMQCNMKGIKMAESEVNRPDEDYRISRHQAARQALGAGARGVLGASMHQLRRCACAAQRRLFPLPEPAG